MPISWGTKPERREHLTISHVVELKAVERLHPIHQAQVITYLKLTGYPAGLLMNFNSLTLRSGLKRLDHPDLYVKKLS